MAIIYWCCQKENTQHKRMEQMKRKPRQKRRQLIDNFPKKFMQLRLMEMGKQLKHLYSPLKEWGKKKVSLEMLTNAQLYWLCGEIDVKNRSSICTNTGELHKPVKENQKEIIRYFMNL